MRIFYYNGFVLRQLIICQVFVFNLTFRSFFVHFRDDATFAALNSCRDPIIKFGYFSHGFARDHSKYFEKCSPKPN